MTIPSVKFSQWLSWSDRDKYLDKHLPGLYLIAKFNRKPDKNTLYLTKEIIYIGETCDQSLKQRWANFHNAAFDSGYNHCGGLNYKNKYGDDGTDLYVAAFGVKEFKIKELRQFFIRYLERKLIWEYILINKTKPVCNEK